MTTIIAIDKLTKYYGKARGIIDVSFEVSEGEIFGFIGPNGAGKSTTLRTLLGLIAPTSGTATIFGMDCNKEGHIIRKNIGYLPSEVFYYDNMKVMDLLKYSQSFYGPLDKGRLHYLAQAMDLDLNRKIDDLSYGNKKKVGIVQGLLHAPKLIILDEPTSGLDPLMQQKFFDLIQEENKKGATVLMSSHILSEVQKLCARVAIIKDGKIVRIEDIQTLRNTAYKKVNVLLTEPNPSFLFNLDGISNRTAGADGLEITALYRGDINKLVAILSNTPLANVQIEEPDLEEIFMHYYSKEA